MEKKICLKCKKEVDLTNYSMNRSTKDGLEHWCKDCKKKAQAIYRKRQGAQPRRKSGNGRRSRLGTHPMGISSPTVPEITPEILFASVRKAIAQEIIEPVIKAIDQIKEKFQIQ